MNRRSGAVALAAAALMFAGGCAEGSRGDTAAPAASARPTETASAAPTQPVGPGSTSGSGASLPVRAGLDYAQPTALARAFAEVYLGYRWDMTSAQQRDALSPFATDGWLATWGEGEARSGAGWAEFVAGHGVVRADIAAVDLSTDADAQPGVAYVDVSAAQVTTLDGQPEQRLDTPLILVLVWDGHPGWRVSQVTRL